MLFQVIRLQDDGTIKVLAETYDWHEACRYADDRPAAWVLTVDNRRRMERVCESQERKAS